MNDLKELMGRSVAVNIDSILRLDYFVFYTFIYAFSLQPLHFRHFSPGPSLGYCFF